MKILYSFGISGVMLLLSCNSSKKMQANKEPTVISEDGTKTDPFLENLLNQYPQFFDSVLNHRKYWNVQFIYTRIDRNAQNEPKLTNYYFNVNPKNYFYPASTVKLPTALLALQRLNELRSTGIDKNTSMLTEAAYSGQTPVTKDSTSANGKPSVGHYVKKIFMVSDNDAMNRLYEFLGQEYLNDHLHKMGYEDVQILHRLQISLSEDENRHTNPVKFVDNSGKILYQQPLVFNQTKYAARNDSLGKAYYQGDKLINNPMNFSKKNRISLEDLHNILRSLIFPLTVPGKQRFNLTPEDYRFVYHYMSQFPPESIYPHYDTAEFYDAYAKNLLVGSRKGSLPKNIRIFNKEGDAYGHLLDIAYIVDFDKNIEFFLSAEIYCNSDGVLNDDKYDYETIGYPFMIHLGKVIYDYEVARKRKHIPDLSGFKMTYDK